MLGFFMPFFQFKYLGVISLLCSSMVYAAPIENLSLSQSNSTPSQEQPTLENNVPTTNINWELMQKNEKLEEEVRKLRGLLEEHDHQIDQLKKDLDNKYADLDNRLQIQQQKEDDEAKTVEDNPPAPSDENKASVQENTASEMQPQTLEKLTDKDAYTAVLEAYKQGGAKQAIKPMENFIQNYKNSVYLGNAHFWLAEFNLALTPPNYLEAKKHYEIVTKLFFQSPKASRALYQLYSMAKDVDKNNVSANLYKQQLLKNYPTSQEARYFK